MNAGRLFVVLVLITCSACGGSGGGASTPASNASPTTTAVPPSTPAVSAGGVWVAFTGGSSALQLMIAENGEMRVTAPPVGTGGPAFGQGAVVVTGNRVAGSYKTRALQSLPASPAGAEVDCTLDGTVSTRTALAATIVCTDTDGNTTTNTWSFLYDSRYETDSSLASIAGSYTLAVNTDGNSLTIFSDGTLAGIYQNGPRCTIGGRVSIIDPDFVLYGFEMTFSGCSAFEYFEGATLTGFGSQNLPGQPAGSFFLLLTAVINGRIEFISVIYRPV